MLQRICMRMLFEVTISTREYGSLLLARFCNLRARRETITTVLLCAEFDHLQLSLSGIALPLLFVEWLAIHGSLESARCFSACHLVGQLCLSSLPRPPSQKHHSSRENNFPLPVVGVILVLIMMALLVKKRYVL